MKGKIHSFQSLGTLDGPGVRFIIFLHGCPLSCGYCHNIDVCRGEYFELSAEDTLKKILNYKEYFGETGGVTISGGEPLLQAEYVAEVFSMCHNLGIHTVLDTSGCLWNNEIEKLLNVTDLVLLDIKMTDDEAYKKYIGCSINAPLFFLEQLEEKGIPCWIRHVTVGGLNDTEENILKLKQLVSAKNCIKKIELLPFKKICQQKYESMSLNFPFADYKEPDRSTMLKLNKIINEN